MEDSRFGYENLEVWQKAIDWVTRVIAFTDTLQTDRKHYRLMEQLEASCCAVPINIAEGKGRFSRREYLQFLYIARGSLYEAMTLLELFLRQGWIQSDQFHTLKREARVIARQLNALIRSIRRSLSP